MEFAAKLAALDELAGQLVPPSDEDTGEPAATRPSGRGKRKPTGTVDPHTTW